MANEYCYYIQGDYIGILEYDEENGWWDSPSEAVTNGFILEYTKGITEPIAYNSSISVNRNVANALVDYLKYRRLEDVDKRQSAYYYGKFMEKARRESNRKIGSERRIIPRRVTALK